MQQGGQAFAADFDTRFEFAYAFADPERGKDALEDRIRRRHDQLCPGLAGLKPVQRGKPPGADRQRGAGAVVGQGIPRREFDHFELGREEGGGIHHAAHRGIIRCDEHRAAGAGAGEIGHHQRLRAARNLRQRERLAGFQDTGKVGHGVPSVQERAAFRTRCFAPCPIGKGVRGVSEGR